MITQKLLIDEDLISMAGLIGYTNFSVFSYSVYNGSSTSNGGNYLSKGSNGFTTLQDCCIVIPDYYKNSGANTTNYTSNSSCDLVVNINGVNMKFVCPSVVLPLKKQVSFSFSFTGGSDSHVIRGYCFV